MLKSPVFAFILNSLFVLVFLWTWFTVFCSSFIYSSGVHFSIKLCNTCRDVWSFNKFKQDTRNILILIICSKNWPLLVCSSGWGISYIGPSYLGCAFEVEAIFSYKISCLACLNVYFSLCAYKCCWGVVFFLNHWCWLWFWFSAHSPGLVPPQATILIFFPSSSLVSMEIHWTFWLFWFLLSCIFVRSIGQYSVVWFVAR